MLVLQQGSKRVRQLSVSRPRHDPAEFYGTVSALHDSTPVMAIPSERLSRAFIRRANSSECVTLALRWHANLNVEDGTNLWPPLIGHTDPGIALCARNRHNVLSNSVVTATLLHYLMSWCSIFYVHSQDTNSPSIQVKE
jgi:hypothetical protein